MLRCQVCGGQLEYLGQLGNLEWFQCRQCGLEASREKVSLIEAEDYGMDGSEEDADRD